MASIDWPLSLPQKVDLDGYRETLPIIGQASTIDAGPPMQSFRSDSGTTVIEITLTLSGPQVATLDDFFCNTTVNGAKRFNWLDPISEAAAEIRFQSPPSLSNYGADLYFASFTIEVMQ